MPRRRDDEAPARAVMIETEGATAPLRNTMLRIMAQERLSARSLLLLPAESKGPYGLTEAEATALLEIESLEASRDKLAEHARQAAAELAHEIDTALDAALRQRGLTSAAERDILASHIKQSLDARGFQITRKDSN